MRGVVIGGGGDSVLPVRHGYVSGWHFPGGGVEVGETCLDALARELDEEACVAVRGKPILHGSSSMRGRHAATMSRSMSIRDFALLGERRPDWEIEEARFFPRCALPEGTTAGTRARLAEIFELAPLAPRW